MLLKKTISLGLFLMILLTSVFATHNRAGEIIYEQIGPLTIRATIKTYTKASSVSADRDSLQLDWGDGSADILYRQNNNGAGEQIPSTDVKINCYVGEHTYASRATYTLSFIDPNRVSGILNVNYPNSVDIPFYLETTFTLLNVQFQGLNNSVELLEPPLDYTCVDQPFIHNPNAYDSDGDSIGYELIFPMMDIGTPVPNYQYPDAIMAGIDNMISLDELTGNFLWDSPQAVGEYNIAIKISEYRNGVLISSIIRDMQISVDNCENSPPIIETEEELCVIAGDVVNIPIMISDPDNDGVKLSGSGGPFLSNAPFAELTTTNNYEETPFGSQFVWETTCDHVQDQYYQVVLRAEDSNGLVDIHTIRIKVLAPPPENVAVEKALNQNTITWDSPYFCDLSNTDNFIGFSVWRKEGSNPFVPENCETGLDGKGYTRLVFLTNEIENGFYTYTDENIDPNTVYCYRITSLLSGLSAAQSPINVAESIPSEEVCILANRDIPYITKASVLSTDTSSGEIQVNWLVPSAVDYDTVANPGPYTLNLFASDGAGALVSILTLNESLISDFSMHDSLIHRDVNTLDNQWTYNMTLSNGTIDKESGDATTVFLTSSVTDQQVNLSWQASTPWQNTEYNIYREIGGVFEWIATTTATTYEDRGLENDIEYCYKIESIGTFSIEPFPDPVVNFSQEHCATPIDLRPPCPVPLEVLSACQQLEEDPTLEEYFNNLSWSQNLIECPENVDISDYAIYYAESDQDAFEQIGQTEVDDIAYLDERSTIVGGCYYIIATDQLGNMSSPSDTICVDKCLIYELPNTFTPNGDNANDLFVPRKNLFVEEVDFKVYNKWGNLLYETTDPELLWDGQNLGGDDVDDGTYYYSCELLQRNTIGILEVTETLSGYIEVLR